MTLRVFCTCQFEGFHKWPSAPDAVAFLRDLHRHIFHVRLEMPVSHTERDREFILLKRELQHQILCLQDGNDTSCWSCEMWATKIAGHFEDAMRVEVSEDNENGAIFERD